MSKTRTLKEKADYICNTLISLNEKLKNCNAELKWQYISPLKMINIIKIKDELANKVELNQDISIPDYLDKYLSPYAYASPLIKSAGGNTHIQGFLSKLIHLCCTADLPQQIWDVI